MLKTRVLTACVLVAALLAALFLLPPSGWLLLSALICGGAAWEWGGLGRLSGTLRAGFAILMAAACFVIGSMAGLGMPGTLPPSSVAVFYAISGLFWLLLVPLWLRRKWQVRSVSAVVAVGLVVLLPSALAFAHLRLVSPWLLLSALGFVAVADIAAYFTGRAFGRHKLAPSISPGKTWEGAAGAGAGTLVFGLIVLFFALPVGAGMLALLGAVPFLLVLTAVSIQGDLFESLLKRQAGVKDSGTLLPGHGGILDRIDSLTSTLPLVGLAVLYFTY